MFWPQRTWTRQLLTGQRGVLMSVAGAGRASCHSPAGGQRRRVMPRDKTSFHEWLGAEIDGILGRQSPVPPLFIWCDPGRQWLDLLLSAAAVDGFELWADPNQDEL